MMYATKLHKKKKRNRRKRYSIPLCDNCQWKEICTDGPKFNCKSYLAEIDAELTKTNMPKIENFEMPKSTKVEIEKITKEDNILKYVFWGVFVLCALYLLIE